MGASRRASAVVSSLTLVCLVLLVLSACSPSGPPSIEGSWTKPGADYDVNLAFDSDGTFGMAFDCHGDVEIDPDYMYGTYTISGNQLHMVVHDPFLDQTSEHDYECTITHKKLTLVELRYTELLALRDSPPSGPPSIVGTWVYSDSNGTLTIAFEADGTFRETEESRDSIEIDPDEQWGTYALVGNQLQMVVHDPDYDDTSEFDYECTIAHEKLTVVSRIHTIEYTRK